mgnify:CR=1 FL=1
MPLVFDRDGETWTQIKRVDDVVLYRKTSAHRSEPKFEVVKLRVLPSKKWRGQWIPAMQTLPGKKGSHGFTTDTLGEAEDRFNEVISDLASIGKLFIPHKAGRRYKEKRPKWRLNPNRKLPGW